MGQEGFSSDSSLLYHRHLPTAIVAAEEYEPPAWSRAANRPLKPRHFQTHKLDTTGADAVLGRQHLLANDDVRISYVVADRPSPLYRNAIGDECLYVEAGRARLESTFGHLELGEGDYAIVPTSVVHRIVPLDGPVRLLAIEATGHIGPPRRYLSVRGQFLEPSPYCERDLRAPDGPVPVDEHRRRGLRAAPARLDPPRLRAAPVRRRRLGRLPVPVGVLDPRLRADHRPGAPAAAGPPDVRRAELRDLLVRAAQGRLSPAGDPGPVQPPQHRLRRVLFYTGGNYEARRGSGIEQGSISLHPSGFTHGPQPGAPERAIGVEAFDELAVMVDTFRPLDLCEPALTCEDTGYAWTWSGRGQ